MAKVRIIKNKAQVIYSWLTPFILSLILNGVLLYKIFGKKIISILKIYLQ